MDASERAWGEAVRRESVIRRLAETPKPGLSAVEHAAQQLSLSVPQIYRLIRAFRAMPLASSMLARQRGQLKGSRRLDPVVEDRIETALNVVYMQPERPTLTRLLRQVRYDCLAAGLKPPSRNAVRARISSRTLRERTKAREGAAKASNQFD